MRVFVDVDGVLLGPERDKQHRFALAAHALDLLDFALRRAEVVLLSPHAKLGIGPAIAHLVAHTKASDRERLLTLAGQTQPCSYRTLRTEALPADGRFLWLDDDPAPAEVEFLRQRGWLDRWLWVDTREDPEDLLRAQRWLAGKLPAPSAGRPTGAGRAEG